MASACAVGPDFARPEVPLHASWNRPGDARISTQTPVEKTWWKTFSDPTLDRLIDLAQHQNLPLQLAGVRILEARAQLGIAVGQQYPTNPGAIGAASIGGLHNKD